VTFTASERRPTIQSWFGSSGGGLPRRPELKSLGRFLFPRVTGSGRLNFFPRPRFATDLNVAHQM
jgi:hypothetical protein